MNGPVLTRRRPSVSREPTDQTLVLERTGEPHARLPDQLVTSLVGRIAKGELKAGERLPSEWVLCESYGVSRQVLREAVAQLKAKGLVESRRGSGVYVREAGEAAAEPVVLFKHGERIADVLDIMELRIGIEVEAAGLAAERRTEAMLAQIGEAALAFRKAADTSDLAADRDVAFHRSIAVATGNPQFIAMLEFLREQLIPRKVLGARFAAEATRATYLDKITTEHDAIYMAIAARDADAARAAMRHHLEGGRNRYRQWRLDPARPDEAEIPSGGVHAA